MRRSAVRSRPAPPTPPRLTLTRRDGLQARNRRHPGHRRRSGHSFSCGLRTVQRRLCRRRRLLRHQRLSDHVDHHRRPRRREVFPDRFLRAAGPAHFAGAVLRAAGLSAVRMVLAVAGRSEALFRGPHRGFGVCLQHRILEGSQLFRRPRRAEAAAAHLEPRGRGTVLRRIPDPSDRVLAVRRARAVRADDRARRGEPRRGAMGLAQASGLCVLLPADARLGAADRRDRRSASFRQPGEENGPGRAGGCGACWRRGPRTDRLCRVRVRQQHAVSRRLRAGIPPSALCS